MSFAQDIGFIVERSVIELVVVAKRASKMRYFLSVLFYYLVGSLSWACCLTV